MAGNTPTQLPAYIQLRYDENGAFASMQSDASNVVRTMRQDFRSAFGDMSKMADKTARDFDAAYSAMSKSLDGALSRNRSTGTGSLDLGITELRKQQAAAEAAATAAQELAAATRTAAQAEGDFSERARAAIAAAEALAVEKRAAAAAARDQADAAEQVQQHLNRQASATNSVIGSTKRLTGANDNLKHATLGATQQVQDIAISLAGGQRAGLVFAQQLPQLAFALSALEGSTNKTADRIGRFATFMSGPWGLAVGLGAGALATLIGELYETEKAAKAAELGADGLSAAQSALGGIFDLTSGRIEHQNELLMMNARLTALNLRAEAMAQRESARTAFANFGRGNLGLSTTNKIIGALGVPVTGAMEREAAPRTLLAQLNNGQIDRETALRASEKLDFSGLAITRQEFQQALIDQTSAEFKDRTAKAIDDSLSTGTLSGSLRKLGKAAKPKVDHSAEKAAKEAERLAKFGDNAEEAIARLNARFDLAPKLIDQTAQATRELDGIIADLEKRKPVGFEKMVADAQTAKAAVQSALLQPVREMREESEKRLAVQDLIAQGRTDEATALQLIQQLEARLGDEEMLRARVAELTASGRKDEAEALQAIADQYPAIRRQVEAIAKVEAQRTREAERQRALFEAQLSVLDQAKAGLTGLLSGKKVDLFGDLKNALQELQGARTFDALFGDAFAQIEDQLRQRSPLGKANARLETGVTTAAGSVDKFATAVETATNRIANAAGDPSLIDGNDITVSAKAQTGAVPVRGTVDFGRMSAFALANAMSQATVAPLLAGMDEILGGHFFRNLSGTIGGIAGGKLVAGNVGAALGGARGLVHDFGPDVMGKAATEKLLGKFDTALAGAQTGTQTAGIMKALGIKTSTTGAQIGGSIGSFTGIPGGDIIGSVIGGLIGGALKKVKWGRVDLTSGGVSSAFGNSGKSKDAATATGGSIMDSLQGIVDQLGGTLGDFGSISVGVRHGDYRVNTGGTSLKKKSGAVDFNEDAEAAMKYAIKQAIERGAVAGIKESTQRLLKAGDDLDAALQDALDWENAFRELKSIKDPLGSALDDLDKQFSKLIDLANQAGASSQEMAQLQELYAIKSAAAIEDAKDRVVGSLRDLLDELTIGDNGLSLRDRRTAALGNYNTLASRVAAGDTTAYDDYAKAAQDLIAIERDLYGSQQEYFDRLNEVTALTKSRIDAETNVVSIAENRDSPFDSTGAVKSSIDSQTTVLGSQLDAVNSNIGATNAALARIEAALAGSSGMASLAFASNF